MPCYTIILDYKGGTYIDQVNARNTKQACLKWVAQLDEKVVFGFGKAAKEKLQDRLANEEPVLLQGLKNVWCLSVLIRGQLAWLNVVQTEQTG